MIRSVLAPSSDATVWRLAPDAVLVQVQDGSARLVDLSGSASALSASASAMLQAALQEGPDAAAVLLAARYKVDKERIARDLAELLAGLERRGMILRPHASVGLKARLRRGLARLVAPLVRFSLLLPGPRLRAWMLMATAWTATRLFGWSNTLAVWPRPLDRSSRVRTPSPAVADEPAPVQQAQPALDAIDGLVEHTLARHPLAVGCKERALACWSLAHAEGIPARVVLGVELFPFALHCWCAHEDRVLADVREGRCDRFTPIREYS